MIKKSIETDSCPFLIDNEQNIIINKRGKLTYYDCNGFFLKEVNISGFPEDFEGNWSLDKESNLYYFENKKYILLI